MTDDDDDDDDDKLIMEMTSVIRTKTLMNAVTGSRLLSDRTLKLLQCDSG